HFQLGTMLDGAAGGLKLTEHQFQQGTLAGAVVADQTDTVSTNDVGGKTAHQRPLARPGKADLVQFDHALARGVGRFHLEAGLAPRCAVRVRPPSPWPHGPDPRYGYGGP